MLDSAAQGKESLEARRYIRLDVERRHAWIKGRYHHHRNVQPRENIDGHLHEGGCAQESNY